MGKSTPVLVITCAAIAREVNEIKKLGQWSQMDLQAITADLHAYQHIFVAYGDCGTSGELDRVLEERGVKRLPGAHCYDFLAGGDRYQQLQEQEPGSFYLTDFLAQHFQRLVIEILGIDRYPELLETYFGNYTRLVYLAQTDSDELTAQARAAADCGAVEDSVLARHPGTGRDSERPSQHSSAPAGAFHEGDRARFVSAQENSAGRDVRALARR
jgi:hypothetical protein